jgi:monoamine oxidase
MAGKRAIVVGAGVAGLAAADALRCAGADVVILEARDRIGGRTWTAPLGSGHIDLGASWVHGPISNPVAEALTAAEIDTRNDGPFFSRMAVWSDGWAEAPDATTLTAAAQADWDPAEAVAALPDSDRYIDGVEWYLADRGLGGRAGDLARFGLVWITAPLVFAGLPDRISLSGAAAYTEHGGGNLVPGGGYGMLVDRLSADLDIRLGTPVTEIDHRARSVVVRSNGGEFEGDHVVVTVPLGVLQAGTLRFNPPLGTEHTEAAERLAMGTLEKIVFHFPERFWPESFRQITRVADDHAFPVWFDFTRHVGSPTLVAFYNPAATATLAGSSAEERSARAREVLAEMFGAIPEPRQTLTTDWANDPWARGSYSYIPLGASVDDMNRLAQPVSSRVILAGEVTMPDCYGTVHAAFGSGLRAAGLILGEPPTSLSFGAIPPHWLPSPST